MSHRHRPWFWPLAVASMALFVVFAGCSSGDPQKLDPLVDDDPVGSQGQELKKGAGGVNCDGNYCDGAVLCGLGEGDCDLDSQCDQTTAAGPLVCVQNNGAKWGCVAGSDVCAPATCRNRKLDPGETQVDCGGPCGPICPAVCVGLPANGLAGHCTIDCPCPSGEGDCNAANNCVQNGLLGALVCPAGNGPKFGFSSAVEMCVPSHCTNRVYDAALGETSKDCGGDCGTICASSCGTLPTSGNTGHCTTQCPCAFEDGDCDLATQCFTNGACLQDRGDLFGFSPTTDVCVATHCSNAAIDGGETALNCGGPDCAPCGGTAIKAKGFGGTGSDYAESIALDAAGNVYMALRYASAAFNIGLGNQANAGKYDILLAKFSPQGVPLWNHRFGNTDADGDHNVALAVDPNGNAYLVANYYGTINLGGSDLTMVGATDFYVAKFDTNGNHVWSKSFGGPAVDRMRHLVVDNAGDLLLVGYFQVSINFGATTLTSAGSNDAFITKLHGADGTVAWGHGYGSTQDDRGYGVATDSAGNVYVAGQIGGTVDLGLGAFTTISSMVDAFLLKLTSAGAAVRATTFGGTTRGDLGATVGVDSSQRPIMTGSFASNIDFGAGPFDPALSDVYVIAYDANLNRRWVQHVGGPGYDYVGDAVVSPNGEIAVSGYFSTSIDLGAGSIPALGTRDAFLIRYTNTGATAWSHTFGGGGLTEPLGIALGPHALHLTGYFEQTVPFGALSVGPAVARDAFWTQFVF